MLNSNIRKRAASGWLKENYRQGFSSSLKLQKFLFFYETLSKVEGDHADFTYLRGYENGPVFSDVYGDYIYRKPEFFNEVESAYRNNPEVINEERAKFASFLVNILTERELSELTHELNIWNAKEKEINKGTRHISLCEEDFTKEDAELLKTLRETYTSDYIDSVEVVEIYNKSFIINKDDMQNFTEEQQNVFITLSNDDNIENPVYVRISEDGVILID